MRRTLIIGATSAIAEAIARELATDGDAFFLVARNPSRLASVAADLEIRACSAVHTRVMDAMDYAQHEAVLGEALEALGGLDLALIAHGSLPDQPRCERSAARTRDEFACNALSAISLLTHLAGHFENQGRGTIVVISSVAGDRGRRSNYVYAAAKGAVSVFCEGLRHRLSSSGVNVLTVKPGLVDTPMTAGFRKSLIWATAQQVGKAVHHAVKTRRHVLYVPWYWRYIMLVIRMLPEFVFNRLRL